MMSNQQFYYSFGSPIDKLETAIYIKDFNSVKKLLEGIYIGTKLKYGSTFLHRAVDFKASKEILEFLVQTFKKNEVSLDLLNDRGRTALDDALMDGNVSAIEILIKAGADYNHQMYSELYEEFPELKKTYLEYFFGRYADQSDKVQKVKNIIEEKEKPEGGFFSDYLNFLYQGYQKLKTYEEEEQLEVIHTAVEKVSPKGKEKPD